MFKRILAAFDGSKHSAAALRYAIGMAASFGADVHVVHAYPQTSDMLGYSDFERLVSRRKAAGEEVLEAARDLIGDSPVKVTEDLLEGPEAEAILSVVRIQKIDLIVMGTRGLGTIEGMVFGSVSRKIAHQARCPIMLVRAE